MLSLRFDAAVIVSGLCKLKNGSLNHTRRLSLFPDNVLQTFDDVWCKESLSSLYAYSGRYVFDDDALPSSNT